MKFKVKHRITNQFSMISMADIMSLLLLFFMLTMPSMAPIGLTINLPNSYTSKDINPQIRVTITSELAYYIDNELVTLEEFRNLLEKKISEKSKLILLQVDKSVPIQHMIKIVDIANSLQARVSVATRPE